ncbi:hypothetical protein [Ulvibacterium marinum]|uniref:Uncharacterized protein n=1 Tax=Ulvibacterium marinum TaxID=2419782 RepID=A0A3B0CCN5_9FLAO|nr:hypothetical protein [Ulvibacterium marinum]RKN82840.1 hypothetical protein D7Z94_03085 [Ulvibacterium marinum]
MRFCDAKNRKLRHNRMLQIPIKDLASRDNRLLPDQMFKENTLFPSFGKANEGTRDSTLDPKVYGFPAV